MSATYDSTERLLTNSSAEGMGSDQRIVVLVRGLTEKPTESTPPANATTTATSTQSTTTTTTVTTTTNPPPDQTTLELVPSARWLYLSVLGPNSDGKVTHTVTVHVPKRFSLVELKAWTGETETNCNSARAEKPKNIRPAEEVGALFFAFPKKPTTTTTTSTTESTSGR